ncbi:MAG: hypothetical protein U9O85_07585 [Euryarchaeota archaeon]|nr:hypothetical protein [Euryarchaeota archaeon]
MPDEGNIEDIIAYLSDELRECARECVSVIEGIGYLKRTKEENKRIVFKVGDQPIAEIECSEDNFYVRYKAGDGKMKSVGGAIYSEEEYKTHKERIKHLVSGAYRRWVVVEINRHFSEIEKMFPEMKDFLKVMHKITTHWMYGEQELSDECIAALRATSEVIAERCEIPSSPQAIDEV